LLGICIKQNSAEKHTLFRKQKNLGTFPCKKANKKMKFVLRICVKTKIQRGGNVMQNQYIYTNDLRRIRPGFGRPGFGRPGFGFGRPGFGFGLGLLGGFATGALLSPAFVGGWGYPPFGFGFGVPPFGFY
jgi:hypothetical protein